MIEEELQHAMRTRAENIEPDRNRLFAAQRTAMKRRHRRDMGVAAVVGSVCTILIVLGVSNVFGPGNIISPGGTSKKQVDQFAQPYQDREINLAAKLESEKPAEPTKASKNRPGQIIAASSAGRLVVIDPQSGATRSVITTMADPSDAKHGLLLGSVTANAASGYVYFDVRNTGAADDDGGCSTIKRASLKGGSVSTFLADASTPSLSHDGKHLAFVKLENCKAVAIETYDIASQKTSTVARLDTGSQSSDSNAAADAGYASKPLNSLSWSPDNSKLLADINYIDASKNFIAVLEVANLNSIVASGPNTTTQISPPANVAPGTSWQFPTYLPDGRIFLSESCCNSSVADTSKAKSSSRMIIIDAKNTSHQDLIAYGYTDRSHGYTTVAPTGAHVAYLSGQDMMVSDNSERPSAISHGLIGITWI